LQEQAVTEVVMESTAQYWRPVWLALEGHFPLQLAQAWSNRAPRGKKTDDKDAERLARRHRAGELTLSFVPPAQQRQLRELSRRQKQLTRQRTRVNNLIESLLEEMCLKLSSVLTDLLGSSGRRILAELVKGEKSARQLAELADQRVKCSRQQLEAALTGRASNLQRRLLGQHLAQITLIDQQMEELSQMIAEHAQPYGELITRLSEIPGIRVRAAEQIVGEVGQTSAFPTADRFSSWIGSCPGQKESAQRNYSGRSSKGNGYLRSVLAQAAQAAVRTKNSYFQQKFKRLLPRRGFAKAIWTIAHHLSIVIWKVLHNGESYIEYGGPPSPQSAQRRLQRLRKELRALGFSDQLKPLTPQASPA
jgi:transposase